MMKVVLDTNVLVAVFSRRSPHHWLFQQVMNGTLRLCITTEILLEYEEVLGRMYGADVAAEVVAALPDLPNVQTITSYFAWQLVSADVDDNKFADCAIAAGADALITEDRHFLPLKDLGFPPVTILSIEEFAQFSNAAK
ncbi:MAG: putative toxin-antitoxin system toxin component, PIN family [Candidatus Kapaibacteriota bacterium]|jgi:putative PIN family toxin of toxin-antitoxin system